MDLAQLTDAELIDRVAAQERPAFEELHRRVVRGALGVALRTLDREDAERATADASAAIWAAAPGFERARDDPGTWLYGVVCEAIGASDAVAASYRAAWDVYRAVAVLPELERQVVELAAWGGMGTEEIASFLHRAEPEVEALARAGADGVATTLGGEWRDGLLAGVAPPPELPPELAVAPVPPRPARLPMPRRYRSTALVATVIVALALFGLGYLVGGGGGSGQGVRTVELAGGIETPLARGDLVVLRADAAGNWPLELTVRGLPSPPGRSYELWLTSGGALAVRAGTFRVGPRETTVTLLLPVEPTKGDGWAVVVEGSNTPALRGEAP